jgi:hypothetical protein
MNFKALAATALAVGLAVPAVYYGDIVRKTVERCDGAMQEAHNALVAFDDNFIEVKDNYRVIQANPVAALFGGSVARLLATGEELRSTHDRARSAAASVNTFCLDRISAYDHVAAVVAPKTFGEDAQHFVDWYEESRVEVLDWSRRNFPQTRTVAPPVRPVAPPVVRPVVLDAECRSMSPQWQTDAFPCRVTLDDAGQVKTIVGYDPALERQYSWLGGQEQSMQRGAQCLSDNSGVVCATGNF